MNIAFLEQFKRMARELEAALLLLKTLNDALSEQETRIKALEDNGNRQRRPAGRN